MRVECGGKCHDFGYGHFRRRAYAGHTLRKLHDKRLGRGAVLRKVVDGRAYFQHRVAHTVHLLHAEDVRQLGDGLRGTFAEVYERDIYNRGGFDILLDGLHRIVAEASALLCEKIKLLTRQSCIHAFEKLVEFEHFGGGHTGVFLRVGKRFLHFGVSVDGFTSGHHQPRNGGHHSHYGRLAVVQPVVEPLPPCLPDSHLRVDLSDFSFKQFDFGNLHIPRGRAALYAVKL